ncbi:MAG: cell division protein FtsZ [Candidatus Edwardsbacteria bacterium]|nr:cell division protein FtsZ [Candidatus Edwardsbacteria bacterium]
MLEFDEDAYAPNCIIKVAGLGGAGGNAVNRMAEAGLKDVNFIAVNTDLQVLRQSRAHEKIQIGTKITEGLGSGGNPEIGRRSFEEDKEQVAASIGGAKMLFITAGMGGGTGTGAAPLLAELARDMGILTVGVVTKPFEWEGRRRMGFAEEGIAELKERVDTLIVIPNQRVLSVVGKQTKLTESFKIIDDILLKAVRGISDLITKPGLINVDFADVKAVMSERGDAIMGVGVASGDNRAITAAEEAIANTLLEGVSIKGAKAILMNISAGDDLTMFEIDEAARVIRNASGDEAHMIFGAVIDGKADGTVSITVIATGLGESGIRLREDVPDGNRIEFPQMLRKENLAKPAFQRKEQKNSFQTIVTKGKVNAYKEDDLEIPTYMRRLMD